MRKPRVFQPGDLIKIDFDPRVGREQAGRRPALVISEALYNERSHLVLICQVTSQVKGYPFEVPLPETGPVQGVVLADHVKSADPKARGARRVGTAPEEVTETVRSYVRLLIGGS